MAGGVFAELIVDNDRLGTANEDHSSTIGAATISCRINAGNPGSVGVEFQPGVCNSYISLMDLNQIELVELPFDRSSTATISNDGVVNAS